jgi:hypothetical protein
MKKIIGYVLAIVGLLGVAAFTVPAVKTALPFTSDQISDTTLLIVSIALLVVGLFIVIKGGRGGKQATEVPIYSGKNIVGYRRR